MKINFLAIVLICLSFSSCVIVGNALSPCGTPKKSDFIYYNPDFKVDSLSNISINNLYVSQTVDSLLYVFKFYSNGMVKSERRFDFSRVSKDILKRSKERNFGYYRIEKDSLKFTTNVCPNGELENTGKGFIYTDSIILNYAFTGWNYAVNDSIRLVLTQVSIDSLQ